MKSIKYLFTSLVVICFLVFAFGSDESSDSKEEDSMSGVTFSGRTAFIQYDIEHGTLVAQYLHEWTILEKVYNIIKNGSADEVKITITDYCKDSYGNINKRLWHKTLDPSWAFWDEAKKYATEDDFGKLSQGYILSSDMDEGTFYCCGRDRGCN
jgi:hypothetical protein